MNIKIFKSKKDLFVLKFEGLFNRPLKSVHFNNNGYFLYLSFHGLISKEILDCPIPDDIREDLIKQKVIVLGFFEDDKLVATQLAPFLVHGVYQDKDFERESA